MAQQTRNNRLSILPLRPSDTELSYVILQVFVSIGLTLNGYLFIEDVYNLIKSGLMGPNWNAIFSNKLRLSFYTSLDSIKHRITEFKNNLNISMDDHKNYNVSMEMINVTLNKFKTENEWLYLSFIALYFVSKSIWNLARNAGAPKPKDTKHCSYNSNSNEWNITLNTSLIAKYWSFLKKLDKKHKLRNKYKFVLQTGKQTTEFIKIDQEFIADNNLLNIFNKIDNKETINKSLKLFYDQRIVGMNVTGKDKDIKYKHIKNIILPNFVDCNKYYLFNIESMYGDTVQKVKTNHQFLFQNIHKGKKGRNNKYYVWRTDAKTNCIWYSNFMSNSYLSIWDSILVNHPLIGDTVIAAWNRKYPSI